MKSNMTLIGMPGAGKSTVGIILAKDLSFGFIDTDILIQINQQKSLQQIINESDHMNLRTIEEKEVLKLNIDNHVIATGGSVPYSEKAMNHLKKISTIVFLKASYEELKRRIHNFETRGIAKSENQTLMELFEERQILYKKYADITVDCDLINQNQVAIEIAQLAGQELPYPIKP
ncbi:Shikimate kinase 1 [Desulfamplus magnetovallimortis]|uniref:Shikimate kinase n=1 Tax=Desulfamplus magnetovallimortis TaxID=1246637 RepID=A0A1W1HCK3_9BACT|nr:shikimate kinase [Desulfamplus magnetovallimortis]SLM30241.1 Shikimate kinase 1 [Desulfamplus magnetovallimortis]